MKIAEVVPQLRQHKAEGKESLDHLARHAARQTLLANSVDRCRIGVEGGFHAIEAWRLPPCEQRGPTCAKKFSDSRPDIGMRLESRLQRFRQG
jgi:hypothetical protein